MEMEKEMEHGEENQEELRKVTTAPLKIASEESAQDVEYSCEVRLLVSPMGFILAIYRLSCLIQNWIFYLDLMPGYDAGSCKTKVIIPPDRGFLAWYNVTIAFLQSCLLHSVIICYFAYVDFRNNGVFGGVFIAFRYLFVPFACGISNCYGFKLVSLIGSLITFVSFVICFFVDEDFWSGLFFGVGGGFGCSMLYTCSIVLPNCWFARKRDIANGFASFGKPLGTLLFPIVMLEIMETNGPKYPMNYTFLVVGALFLLLFLMSLFMGSVKGSDITFGDPPTESGKKRKVTFRDLIEARYLASHLNTINESVGYKLFCVHNNIAYPSVLDIVGVRSVQVAISSKLQKHCTDYPMRRARNRCCNHTTEVLSSKDHLHIGARPFYRIDIFFRGNIGKLAKYRTQETQLDYHMGMTRAMTEKDLNQELQDTFRREAFFRVLNTMLNFTILKSPSTLLVMAALCISTFGYFTLYILLNERAISLGYSFQSSYYFYFFFGFGTLFGKLLGSMLLLFVNMSSEETIYAHMLFLGGVASIVSNYTDKYYYHISYSVLIGIISGLDNLRWIILYNATGLEELTNMFGVYFIFNAMAAFLGISFSVLLLLVTGSYAYTYNVCGVCLIVAALLLYPARVIKTLVRNKHLLYV